MSHEQLIFDYDEEAAMQQLVAFLVRGRGQFSVCPYPQDVKHPVRTGWAVSWPKGQAEIVVKTEQRNSNPPSDGPAAA